MLLNDPYQKKLLFSISILSCTLLVTGCWCCFSFEKWTFRLLFIVVRWWWRWWWWRRRWFFFLFVFILLLGVVVFRLFCCFLTLYRIQMKREKKMVYVGCVACTQYIQFVMEKWKGFLLGAFGLCFKNVCFI